MNSGQKWLPVTVNWLRNHRVIATLLALIALGVMGNLASGDDGDPDTAPTVAKVEETSDPVEEPTDSQSPTAESEEPITPKPSPRETVTTERSTAETRSEAEPKPDPVRGVRRHRVLRVVDGDTVEVAYRGGTPVRVIGIDTPETVHPSQPVECGGPRASRLADQLLAGKKVRLVFDRSQGRTDTYGRTLAYLEAPGVGDFGLAMVRRGAAVEYTHDYAYDRQDSYRAAEGRAQSTGRGLWRMCGGPDVPLNPPGPEPAAEPTEQEQDHGAGCEADYDPCVPAYPPDLDCADVNGPLTVTGSDPHGLDADGDGSACES